MSAWDDLVTTALVGTERQRPRLPQLGSPLGDALGELSTRDPQAALLAAAGMVALYQRAGQLPGALPSAIPDPSPTDTIPSCSPLAARHLELILGGKHREVLPEWLSAAGVRGVRAPGTLIPALLNAGKQNRALRTGVAAVVGRRGLWLAQQNPEWRYLLEVSTEEGSEGDEAVWETGSPGVRESFLAQLRERDPGRARDLLVSAFPQEPADIRTKLLATFRAGLSLDDEPFLERCLDDRSKQVRETAAELLTRIPQSGLACRMIERGRGMLAFPTSSGFLGIGRKVELRVTLPEACPKEWTRDGIDPKPPSYLQIGEKSWWLHQVLATIPPGYWCENAGQGVGEILELAARTDWKRDLFSAWTEAAERHADPEWAEALLLSKAVASPRPGLFDALRPGRRDSLLQELLRQNPGPLNREHPVLPLLGAYQQSWSEPLARTVLERVRERVGKTSSDWSLYGVLPTFGMRIPPALADEVAGGWPQEAQNGAGWSQPIEQMVSLVQFRRDMLAAIQLEEIRR